MKLTYCPKTNGVLSSQLLEMEGERFRLSISKKGLVIRCWGEYAGSVTLSFEEELKEAVELLRKHPIKKSSET